MAFTRNFCNRNSLWFGRATALENETVLVRVVIVEMRVLEKVLQRQLDGLFDVLPGSSSIESCNWHTIAAD